MSKLLTVMHGAVPLHEAVKTHYNVRGYTWQPENLLIIRDTSKKANNTFQDSIAVVTDSGVYAARCAAVYGTKWNPETRKKYGVQEGNIVPGFYRNVWRFGKHNGKAFVQVGPVDWWVDSNLDKQVTSGERVVKSDVCALNIHRKIQDNASSIDFASAGCIVPQKHSAMDSIVEICGWTGPIDAPPAKKFNGLIVESDFPFFASFMRLI